MEYRKVTTRHLKDKRKSPIRCLINNEISIDHKKYCTKLVRNATLEDFLSKIIWICRIQKTSLDSHNIEEIKEFYQSFVEIKEK